MSVMSGVERQLAIRRRADLIGAVAAGVCVGAARSGLNALNHDPSLWAVTRWTIIAIAAYVAVAKLLQLLWKGFPARICPRWLLTAFVGSIVYVAALLAPNAITGWYDPYRVDGSLTEYALRKLSSATFSVITLSTITLPILGAFHYFEQIRKAVKAWHFGSPPPRIT
jgi:hypothetical protein